MNSITVKYFNLNYFFILIFLLIISHFLPFERYSVGPDDFALNRPILWLKHFLITPDRPFQYLWFDIQNIIVGDNGFIGLIYTVVCNLFNITVVYIFFISVFRNKIDPFILTIIYILIFNRNEIYHYPELTHIIVASTIYILSITLFIFYIQNKNNYFLLMSFLTYVLGIFWYEVGFFMPLLIMYFIIVYLDNFQNKILKIYFLSLIFIAVFYAFWRITGAFGLLGLESSGGRQIQIMMLPNAILDLFNSFFGRYVIKNIIYGFYNFFKIDFFWLILIIFFDILFIYIIVRIVKNNSVNFINLKQYIYLSFLLIFIFLIPSILSGSIGPRTLIISSSGISILLLLLFSFKNKLFKKIFVIYIIFSLIISQGISWTHVVSSRINGSVYNFLKENKYKIENSSTIIFDTSSFANNIPYSFINNDFNVLNTYYGAQTFENWGLQAMVENIADMKDKKIYTATSELIMKDQKNIEFFISNVTGHKKIKKTLIKVPNDNILIINYKKVYSNKFNKGLNR